MHKHLVVHRDLKPENVLVFQLPFEVDPRIVLCDFAVSKMIDPESSSKMHTSISTVDKRGSWAAPEMIHRDPYTVSIVAASSLFHTFLAGVC